jgi:probable addiction module antidote protein
MKAIKSKAVHRPWRDFIQDWIREPRQAAEYLNAAAEQGDGRAFLIALKDVIDVHGGVSRLARKTKLNRGNLYRMLSGRGFPRLDNLARVLKASGLRISIEPAKRRRRAKAAVG